jgi:biopolymer transport protein ExbD
MIATLSMTMQHGMPVNLPEASSTTNKVQQPVSLTITENGDLFYNKDMITIHELQTRLIGLIQRDADPTIVINADEHVQHGLVVKVMDKVRLSGIPNMAIATEPETTP